MDILNKQRVNFPPELLNECMVNPYRTHLFSSVYYHHAYAKSPALTHSFHDLGDKDSTSIFP